MKKAIHLLVAAIASNYKLKTGETYDYIRGLLFGLVEEDNLPEIESCMQHSEDVE